jgi:uncharacterized membrane protein YjgN (DUF898 family)
MSDRVEPADPPAPQAPATDRDPFAIRRPSPSVLDVVPIGPNLLATLAGFVYLMAAPWIYFQVLDLLAPDVITEDQLAASFVLMSLQETLVMAVVGALFVLVIGVILQGWQYQRPFASRRPIQLAFPIAFALILPDSLVNGGSVLIVAAVSVAVTLAFAVHWGMLQLLRESMD